MNRFTIDHLRDDAECFISSMDPSFDLSLIDETIADHNTIIDFLVEALIGSQAMDLLSAPGSTWCYYVDYAELWIGDPDTCQAIWLG